MVRDRLIYDFEVFKEDWMVVIYNYDKEQMYEIINDSEKLKEFHSNNDENIYIGYNNRGYDQWIMKGILLDMSPQMITKYIIEEKQSARNLFGELKVPQMYNFDLLLKDKSLKVLEGFMGSKIKESSIDFTIDRKLTESELIEVLEYCRHDVMETVKVYENLKSELDSQLLMMEAFDLDMRYFEKTKAQLSAIALEAKKPKYDRDDEYDFAFPDTLILDKYKYVEDWYRDNKNRNYKKKLFAYISGVLHIFAFGGIHGAKPSYFGEGDYVMSDISSMYPALMIEYDYLTRNVKDANTYRDIRDRRLVLKAEKNPIQLPLKIVLNGTYGSMKFDKSDLYDPLMANNVCIAGQLLLLDLIEKVEPYCELIQSNTDGILVKFTNDDDKKKYFEICDEWSARVRMDLEHDEYCKVVQKDVNNYIIVEKDGSYKSKGSYVKKLNSIDYDLPIVNEALVKYFTENKPVEETINKCDELIKFQKIVKVTSNYKFAIHERISETMNDKKLIEKVFRVFASTREIDGGIFKVKEGKNPEKIANTPEKCFIDNEDVTSKKCPDYLDKNYYIDMTNERIKQFTTNQDKIDSGIKYVSYESLEYVKKHKCDFTNYVDLYFGLYENGIKKKELEVLTMLGEFENLASISSCLELFKLITFTKNKTMSYEKLRGSEFAGIEFMFRSISETDKKDTKYIKFDKLELYKMYMKSVIVSDVDEIELMKLQYRYLGYVDEFSNESCAFEVKVPHKKNKSIKMRSLRNNKTLWFNFKDFPEEIEKGDTLMCKTRNIKTTTGWKGRKNHTIEEYEIL